jgi:hypothetical protein
MEEGNKRIVYLKKKRRDEVFSKVIRAGQRTYFFDVKSDPNDLFITITESKKRFNREGRFFYEKHKLFLYREDFEKFVEGLNAMFDYVQTIPLTEKPMREPDYDFNRIESSESLIDFEEPEAEPSYTHIDFEDLGENR